MKKFYICRYIAFVLMALSLAGIIQIACSKKTTNITQPIHQDTIIVKDCSQYRYWAWADSCEVRCNGLAKQLIELKAELRECRGE